MTTSTPALNDSPVTPVPTKEESPTNPAAEAWSSFQENSANHQLSVLHEDGLYRHFRMSEPGTHMWSWDIVTWPGHLATSGDIADGLNLTEMTTSADGLTFSREPDMVGFFALANHKRVYYSDGAPSIDFRYWAEKLQGDQRETTREYKHENFIRFVTETLTECLVDGRGSHFEQLTQDQADELIAEANSLEHFESETREWLRDHEEEFPDAWENDFKDYSFHFQVACYAINAAVHAYLDRNTVRSDTNERTKS